MQAPRTAPLRLADHVRACRADGQVILLDLRRDRYVGVSAPSVALARAIRGWPTAPDPAQACEPAMDIETITGPLRAQGLLTRLPGPEPATTDLEEPTRSLDADDLVPDAAIGPQRLLRFVMSAVTASAWLRWQSLAATAQALAARRARLTAGQRASAGTTMRHVVAAYLRLRPFAFTAHERCLHDSLSLVHFLAGEGVAARWVIGVRTQPFGAHAWVQSGPTVLNDPHERVRRYTPILVV